MSSELNARAILDDQEMRGVRISVRVRLLVQDYERELLCKRLVIALMEAGR